MYIIAADVGGTKTRFIYADARDPHNVLFEARYESAEFDSFEPLLKTFLHDSGSTAEQIDSLTLALPGLVNADSARLTNLPWVIKKQSLKDTFGISKVLFMNDFQASVFGTGLLQAKDQIILNPGTLNPGASNLDTLNLDTLNLRTGAQQKPKKNVTRVAVGAGTGLGVAWAQDDVSDDGQLESRAFDTEGGHIDFAPVDETQIRLLQFFLKRHGHVSYERILSGEGLVSLYDFYTNGLTSKDKVTAEWVSTQAENNTGAAQALSLFVQIYGAYIGNIALLFKPKGGIYITGGIAAKIVDKMQSEDFINAYLNKGRMRKLVEQISVYLVTDERIGVLGAMSQAVKTQQVS